MKYQIFRNSLAMILGLAALWLSSCSKSDSPYYDYENQVQSYNGTIYDYLKAQPAGTFDSLLVVLDRFPDLQDSLTNEKLTLYAPVNENFAAAIKYLNKVQRQFGQPDFTLNSIDVDQLDTLLCRYIIRDVKTTDDFIGELDGLPLMSIKFDYPMHARYVKLSASGFVNGGASALDFSNPFGSTLVKDWITSRATTVNIRTNNGTINILSPTHNFGFDEFTYRMITFDDDED